MSDKGEYERIVPTPYSLFACAFSRLSLLWQEDTNNFSFQFLEKRHS